MYQINDIVLYGSQGVCRVSEIIQKSFQDKTMEYYVLKPVYDDSTTLFLPTQNKASTEKLRRVLSTEEIEAIIQEVRDDNSVWIENKTVRKDSNKEIVARGNRSELVNLIKTFYLHQEQQKGIGKKLHIADEQILKSAEKLLCDEFALVLGIKREQVLPLILQKAQAE